jgi:hypothetical protein
MKYTVKVDIFNQKDVNARQARSGLTLPVQLESVQAYKIVTDIVVPGSGSLTPNALKTQLRDKFNLVSPISESLSADGNVISGSAGITAPKLAYSATIPAPVSGSN